MAASDDEVLDDEVVEELESAPAELPPLLLPQAAAPIMRVAAATAESAIRVFIRVLLGVLTESCFVTCWSCRSCVPCWTCVWCWSCGSWGVRSGDLHDDGVPSGGPVRSDPGELRGLHVAGAVRGPALDRVRPGRGGVPLPNPLPPGLFAQ